MSEEKGQALEMKEVTKVFGRGPSQVCAVDGVNLFVARGEVVLVMGPSGSGKSTLLTMAGTILQPTSGDILVLGKNIGRMSERGRVSLRRHSIGFVFQSFNLLSALTALENVEVPMLLAGRLIPEAQRRARTLLEEFGLSARLSAKPATLSAGEQQRVSIARALANDPDLILADEPTANLDSQRGREIVESMALAARTRSKALVVVTHDPRILDIADRVLLMEDGRLRDSMAE